MAINKAQLLQEIVLCLGIPIGLVALQATSHPKTSAFITSTLHENLHLSVHGHTHLSMHSADNLWNKAGSVFLVAEEEEKPIIHV